MIMNATSYKCRADFNDIMLVSPIYEDAMKNSCQNNSFSSLWTMIALADVICIPIQSLYPKMNGEADKVPKLLTKVIEPMSTYGKYKSIPIMWTKLGESGPIWLPNHFVPLIDFDMSVSFINEEPEQKISIGDVSHLVSES